MVHHDYIFFLQNKNRQFWGLDASGNVTINANPYPLVFSPDGWLEITIENIRNKKYWAVDRTVSAPFKYVEDGAKILKHIFYKKGVEESVYLVICEQQLYYDPGVEYGYWYKQIFRSEIDLSTFDHAGAYVTAATAEEGLAKHLKANENTEYLLDLNVPEAVTVKEDGVALAEKANYLLVDGLEVAQSMSGATRPWFAPFSLINTEGQSTGIAFLTQELEYTFGASWATRLASVNYAIAAAADNTASVDVRITGTIKFTCVTNIVNSFKMRFIRSTLDEVNQDLYLLFSHTPVIGTDYSFDIDITVPLAPGERLYLEGVFTSVSFGGDIAIEFLPGSDLSVEFSNRFRTSYIKALRPQYIWNELIMRATDGEYTAEDCPYFDIALHGDKVFTSGNGIRGLEDATLPMSITKFLSFWNTFDEVGIRELNKRVLLGRKNDLVDQSTIIDLGEAVSLKISYDKELPFNELAIGYPDVKNENGFVNGKNEFNTTFVFSLGTTKNPRKYEKVSQVQASCYAIENLRIENFLKDTTDNRSDNDAFVLHIADTLIPEDGDIPAHYELDRELNAFLSGVDSAGSIFNVSLSPKRCFIRSGDHLHNCQYLADNKKFKFIKADRNKDMEYVNGSDIVQEAADVTVGSLAAKFMNPVLLKAEVIPPDTLNDDLDTNPISIFQFTFDGVDYKGISIRNSINRKRNKVQTFELWPTADTDLTPLIEYYGG